LQKKIRKGKDCGTALALSYNVNTMHALFNAAQYTHDIHKMKIQIMQVPVVLKNAFQIA
jgi:hypothetical protein